MKKYLALLLCVGIAIPTGGTSIRQAGARGARRRPHPPPRDLASPLPAGTAVKMKLETADLHPLQQGRRPLFRAS